MGKIDNDVNSDKTRMSCSILGSEDSNQSKKHVQVTGVDGLMKTLPRLSGHHNTIRYASSSNSNASQSVLPACRLYLHLLTQGLRNIEFNEDNDGSFSIKFTSEQDVKSFNTLLPKKQSSGAKSNFEACHIKDEFFDMEMSPTIKM